MAYTDSVGFVGLGGMGAGLVKNLLVHGVPVSVLDRRAEAVDVAVGRGARAAESATELARSSDVLMVCVNTADESCTAVIKAYERLSGVEARLPEDKNPEGEN